MTQSANENPEIDLLAHWNAIFANRAEATLGWYEQDVSQTLKFIDFIEKDEKVHSVFIPGVGVSRLADELLARGKTLFLNDISEAALATLQKRLGSQADSVTWLVQDIAQPLPAAWPLVDLWLDRAVLHFLREPAAIEGYFANLRARLRPGGYALLAEFSTDGAAQCAGLPLKRYGLEALTQQLPDFRLLKAENYNYINPSAEARPYLYALYQKSAAA